MTEKSLIEVPAGGARIEPGKPTPDNPIIPFIEGDGTGVDITPVMIKVVDAAVAKAYGGKRADPLDGDLRRREVDHGLRPRRVAAGRDARRRARLRRSRSRAR